MRTKDAEMPSEKKVRTRVLASMFTCKICNKLIKDSTAIADCLHSFCEKCIYKKVYEEKCHNCPVCNVDINGSLLRSDTTMRSLKVSLLGVHKRTPEQRAESKRMKLENMKASHDQAKKPQSTKKPVIAHKDKGKGIVIDKPLEDERITSQSTKKPPSTYKDKGNVEVIDEPSDLLILPQSTKKPMITHKDKEKGIVIDKPLEDKRISSQSTKKPPITYKDKGNMEIVDGPSEDQRVLSQSTENPPLTYNDKRKAKVTYVSSPESQEHGFWGSVQVKPRSKKRTVSRSLPPRSPPPPLPSPPVDENEMMASSKSEGKRPMQEIIPMDHEKMPVTATTVSGTTNEEPKMRVRQKRVATPSNGTMISPQDVIDAGRNINPANKTHCAWFILAPSKEQNKRKKPLRPLSQPNLRIKFDRNTEPTVSILKKYLAKQLKLDSWEKVGMFMFGSLVSPESKLVDVENKWMELVGSERQTVSIGTSAYQFCIHLTYA